MRASTNLVAFLKAFESCRLTPYRDTGGKLTVGWGHLMQPSDDPTATLTQDEADALFEHDLLFFEDGVTQLVNGDPTQNEFDALVSFAFNVGLDNDHDGKAEGLGDSTLLRLYNAADYVRAAMEFTKWGKVGARWDAGVLRRRAAECAVFLISDYSRVP